MSKPSVANLLVIAGFLSALPPTTHPVSAAERNTCQIRPTATVATTDVIDNQTVRLADGTRLRLAGILAPTALDGGSGRTAWPPEQQAQQALENLVRGKSAGFALTDKRRDRYGRLTGHLFVDRQGEARWVQAELVANGVVRVDVNALTPPCARVLLDLENDARANRTGLWSHAAYHVRTAARPRELLRFRSTFQIVEGTVHKVAHVRKRIYINFDRNWRTDFTIGLTSRSAARLGLTAHDLSALAGRRVRVRGWIERRGGPYIYLRSRSQLELLPAPSRQRGPVPNAHAAPPPEHGRPAVLQRRRRDRGSPKQNRPAVSRPGGSVDL